MDHHGWYEISSSKAVDIVLIDREPFSKSTIGWIRHFKRIRCQIVPLPGRLDEFMQFFKIHLTVCSIRKQTGG